jgi:hypothetical protein
MEGDDDVERQEHTIARYRLLRRRGKRMRRGVLVPIEVRRSWASRWAAA